MKKIFLIVLLLFCVNVSAKDIESNFTGIMATKTYRNIETTSRLNYIYVDGKISYCIEPGVMLGENGYIETDNFESVGISKNLKEYIELIVYYGYEYKRHNTLEYYMATQQILWEQLGSVFVSFRKDGVVVDVSKHRNEIYGLLEKHDIIPSFIVPDLEKNKYDVYVDEEFVIEDKNSKINDYISDSKDIKIEDNKIIFKSNEIKENVINFTNKVKAGTSLVYYNPINQDLATFTLSNGNEKTFTIKINVKDKLSDLVITKIDSKTKDKLKGATFRLYLGDLLVGEESTDKNGKLVFEKLKYGDYILKEVKAPKGYILNEDSINISLDEESESFIVENTKYVMPVTSDIDEIYYKFSFSLLTLGLIINYVFKKVY